MRLYAYLGLSVMILSVSLYVMYLRNTVEILENENQSLTTEIANVRKTLNSLRNDYSSIQDYNIRLSKTVSDLKLREQSLQQKLQKLNSNFSEMISKHPKMVSDIINNSQNKTNECFEKLSKGMKCE